MAHTWIVVSSALLLAVAVNAQDSRIEDLVRERAGNAGSSGRAAILASAARATGAAEEFEYHLEAWSSDNLGVRSGVVTVRGFQQLMTGDLGDVRWSISGEQIHGFLVKNGANVASFEGSITEGQAQGSIKSWSGESGEWIWIGPLADADDTEEKNSRGD